MLINNVIIFILRASSVEPERMKASPKERIIPIAFEKSEDNAEKKDNLPSPPTKPPMARMYQAQISTQSQRYIKYFFFGLIILYVQ